MIPGTPTDLNDFNENTFEKRYNMILSLFKENLVNHSCKAETMNINSVSVVSEISNGVFA